MIFNHPKNYTSKLVQRSCKVNLNKINIIKYNKSCFISMAYHYRVTRDFDTT